MLRKHWCLCVGGDGTQGFFRALQALRLKLKAKKRLLSRRQGLEAKASAMFSKWVEPRSHSAAQQTPPPPISGPLEFNDSFTGKDLTGNAAVHRAEEVLDRKRRSEHVIVGC